MKRTTNRGKIINLDELIAQQPTSPALGNMKVNARGDVLGPGGEVVQTNTRRVRAYYKDNPRSSTHNVSLKPPVDGKPYSLEPDVLPETEVDPGTSMSEDLEIKPEPKPRTKRNPRAKKNPEPPKEEVSTQDLEESLEQAEPDELPDVGYDVASIEVELEDGDIVMMTPTEYEEYLAQENKGKTDE